MTNLCCICKTNPAYIHIEGEGDYCRDCHNKKVLDKFGVKNDFSYANTIIITDGDGEIHTFNVEHIILGSIVSWEAREVNGDYSFKEISDIRSNGSEVAQRFFKKIFDGVNNKTLELASFGKYYIKDKGNIQIVEDDINQAAFVIDGKKVSYDELSQYFSAVSGFNIQYKVCDASEPLLGKDEYLMKVKLTKDELVEEFERIIDILSDNGFMSYKLIPIFNEFFFEFTKKLELFYDNKREEAIEAGKAVIEILKNIQNDDFFPEYEIETIKRIISKYDFG